MRHQRQVAHVFLESRLDTKWLRTTLPAMLGHVPYTASRPLSLRWRLEADLPSPLSFLLTRFATASGVRSRSSHAFGGALPTVLVSTQKWRTHV